MKLFQNCIDRAQTTAITSSPFSCIYFDHFHNCVYNYVFHSILTIMYSKKSLSGFKVKANYCSDLSVSILKSQERVTQ